MSAVAARWESACARLGVKPRQFAVLLSVTAVAVSALAARTALRPSRAPVAAAPAAAPAAPAAAAERLPVVELALESRPARDPFRPFFLLADAAPAADAPTSGAAAGARSPGDAAASPAAPAGLSLRAAIAGELAVIGEQTVGIGDEVADDAGRRFVVEEIHERKVVLREGMRRTEVGYSRAPAAAAKGARK